MMHQSGTHNDRFRLACCNSQSIIFSILNSIARAFGIDVAEEAVQHQHYSTAGLCLNLKDIIRTHFISHVSFAKAAVQYFSNSEFRHEQATGQVCADVRPSQPDFSRVVTGPSPWSELEQCVQRTPQKPAFSMAFWAESVRCHSCLQRVQHPQHQRQHHVNVPNVPLTARTLVVVAAFVSSEAGAN
jgi:hypothetical protein